MDLTGEQVTYARRKWGDLPHYEVEGVCLGDDEHGAWVATSRGMSIRRGGVELRVAREDGLYLLPRDTWWTVWFAEGLRWDFELYVDVCTPVVWEGPLAWCYDLDLDVIRRKDGRVEVVDEDELEEHAVTLGYPDDLVEGARASAASVRDLIERRVAPFDDTAAEWWSRREAAGP